MRFKQLLRVVALLALLALLLPGLAAAQSVVTGGIAGSVTDPTGAVIVGAKITLSDPATGATQTVTSSASGVFNLALLKPGHYNLTVSRDGFKTAQLGVDVILGQIVSANVKLETGSISTTVEVTGTGELLQTENANLTSNFDTQQIQNIPNPGGDITYIAQTAPGITMNNSTAGGYGNFSAFGLPGTANLFTVNGNDYNDPFLNLNNSGASNLLLGGNELQEVAVVSNGYTGQYGRQAGAQIDYTTKSGSNAFHGDAVYYWTGRALNANDPVNKAFGGTRPFENNNQWAASLGGPIKKDKAWFFVNTEGIRYIFGSIHDVTVPTTDFENYVNTNIASQGAAVQGFYSNLFNLYNTTASAHSPTRNVINANAPTGGCTGYISGTGGEIIDPISGNPLPAALQDGGCTESFGESVSDGNKEWLLSGRVDYSFSDTDKIFGRVKFDRGLQPTYTDSFNPIFNDSSNQPQNEGQLNYTHVFSPNVVNNFIGSVLYYSAIFGNLSPGPALALFPGNFNFIDGSLTAMGTGAGQGGYNQGFEFPQGRRVTQWQLIDDLSVTRGNHAFKMGFNFRRDDISDLTAAELTLYPGVNLSLPGFAYNEVAPTNCSTAALNNVPCGSVQYNFASSIEQPVAIYSFGLYFQDEYRVNSKLKLTMTLRADRNSGGVCQSNCASLPINSFNDLAHGPDIPYSSAFGGSFQTGLHTIIPNVEKVVFEPRFGLAWTPLDQNTVIRAGVGQFTDLYPGTLLSGFDTNFPQVNLWNLPVGTAAFDLNPPGSTAFPTSGVTAVAQCNAGFTSNYFSGGNYNTYAAANPGCGVPNMSDISRNFQNPKYIEWNLEIQHSFGPHTVVSANYVGNRGYDLIFPNNDYNGFGFGPLPATAPDPRVGNVFFIQNGGISNYNGVTLSVQEQNWHGLSGRFNYTYSHAMDDVSNGGVLPFSVITSIGRQINPYNPSANYGSSDYDARHQISGSWVYQLPFKSSNRLMDLAIGGWMASGTLFFRTGFPFSFVDGATQGGLAGNNLVSSTILLQPVSTFTQRNFGNVRNCLINPCWTPSDFQTSTGFGGGRNDFVGPGFLGGDLSLKKNFNITERYTFQLGISSYNFLNHANYGVPYPNNNSSIFGLPVFTETPPTSPYGAFAAAATDMRMYQITGKFIF
jgi:hypothetical protein